MIIFSNNNHSIVNVSDTPSARLPYSGNASRAISLNKVGMKFYYRKQLRRALTYFLAAAKADKTYYWAWFNAACVHARLGQKDKAFSCLKTSISLNNWLRLDAFSDGDLKSLHGDPRFAKLKEKQVMHLRSRINGGWIGLRWGLLKLVLSKNGSFYFQSAESVYEKFKGRFVIKGKNIRFHLTNGTTQVVPILKQSLALVIKFNFSKKETIRFLLKPNLSSSEYEIAKRWARKRYRFFNKIFTSQYTPLQYHSISALHQ